MKPHTLLIFCAALCLGSANAAVLYSHDDGTAETAVGVGAVGDLMILNQFTAQVGGETINQITINWERVPDGTSASLMIYDNPNNDGTISSLVLLDVINVVTSDGSTAPDPFNSTFAEYAFPETAVSGEFYVGAVVNDMAADEFPFGYDTTDPDLFDVSFFVENTGAGNLGTSDPLANSTLSGNIEDFITNGNFMLRAENVTPVPEPSAALLVAFGLAMGLGRRRR